MLDYFFLDRFYYLVYVPLTEGQEALSELLSVKEAPSVALSSADAGDVFPPGGEAPCPRESVADLKHEPTPALVCKSNGILR